MEFFSTFIRPGLLYFVAFFFFFLIDSLLIDDEPLWEPIEWSLVQSWIFFIFIFAWIGENLISSRFGAYTGRDKRLWFAWYKTFWLIDWWFLVSFFVAFFLVITPFYYELTYKISFVMSWWNWYSRSFFFKFIFIFTIILFCSQIIQLSLRWLDYKKLLFLIFLIILFLTYLLFSQFVISLFCYTTDPIWYQRNRKANYIQLSHEPHKWGWGDKLRDHFSYHSTTSVFWFKNDNPFAEAFFLLNMFFLLNVFFLLIYWLMLFRSIYSLQEVSYTYTIFSISALKQFFYFFMFFYSFIIVNFFLIFLKVPFELSWYLNQFSILFHFFDLLMDFVSLML